MKSVLRQITLIATGCIVLASSVYVAGSNSTANSSAPAMAPAIAAPASSRKIARQLKREARKKPVVAVPKIDPGAAARCDLAESETAMVLPSTRLYYSDWRGEEPDGDDRNVNRASGCFYETGLRTEFGFANIIDGSSFGDAKAAGDFVAFSVFMWVAADGSDDGLQVWNMRTGQLMLHDAGCSIYNDDCSIQDIELTAAGSIAYSACLTNECRIIKKAAGDTRRSVVARIRTRGDFAVLLVRNSRLYWLNARSAVRSIRFE